MFKSNNYSVIESRMPVQGMNQNIAYDSLPKTNTQLIENIIPVPLGQGKIRYGCEEIPLIGEDGGKLLNQDDEILLISPIKNFLLLYVSTFKIDTSLSDKHIDVFEETFQFISDHPYKDNTSIKIKYSLPPIGDDASSDDTVVSKIINFNSELNGQGKYQINIKIEEMNLPLIDNLGFVNILEVYYQVGHIYKYNITDRQIYKYTRELAVDTVPRSIVFNGKLLICNGVDPVIIYDDSKIFEEEKWFQLTSIPSMSYLFVAHNRIWGLAEGKVSNEFRNEPFKIYFTFYPNTPYNWIKKENGVLVNDKPPHINIGEKHGVDDNIEAITMINNQMAFVGRYHTQVWQGEKPLNTSEFIWSRTIKTGIPHGNLIQSIGDDVFFVSQHGLRSFNTLSSINAFSSSSITAVDPLIKDNLKQIRSDEFSYRKTDSFFYTNEGMVGFKIGQNKTIIGFVDSAIYGFGLFSNCFSNSICYNTSDKLYMSTGSRLLNYKDGSYGNKIYNERLINRVSNGKPFYKNEPIYFNWTLPFYTSIGPGFASKRFELDISYGSSFALMSGNSITVSVYGESSDDFIVSTSHDIKPYGDLLNTIEVSLESQNQLTKESIGFRTKILNRKFIGRMRFNARSFTTVVHGYSSGSRLVFKKLSMYGRK